MDSFFSPAVQQSILKRIDTLKPDSQRKWGKMDVAQMMAHCCRPLEGAIANKPEKRALISYLFGKVAKKKLMEEAPFKQSLPTAPNFVIVGAREFEKEKANLKSLISQLAAKGPGVYENRVHPFFGPMTAAEWDKLTHKHLDHHLRQFGA